MTLFVTVMMFGWIPILLVLFSCLPPRRAVLWGFLLAWLFLPMAEFKFPGLPPYNKMSATCLGVLLGAWVFDSRRIASFRFQWVDVPMLVWCLVPLASSLTNGLGPYDGVSAVFRQTVTWGLPYYIGRLYFCDPPGLRDLALGIFIGGLAYVPLCLFEIRMSPQLHNLVYGFHAAAFEQTARFGGWRPTVFMAHGLMVGLWMASASLIGFWLWQTRSVTTLRGWTLPWLEIPLLATTVLCKSFGALVLLAIGMAVLFLTRQWRSYLPLIALALIPAVYIGTRVFKGWDGRELVSYVQSLSGERAESLQFRLENETRLAEKAMRRPLFGWGGWNRNRILDEESGEDVSITDSSWILVLGVHGLFGLAAWLAVLLVPVLRLVSRVKPAAWSDPNLAGPAVLAVLLVLYTFDNLFNAMVNPIFMLAAGGLIAWPAPAAIRLPRPQRKLKHAINP